MLKQILETMYVDPELLELMTNEQKELLFRQMRDEQLRRWKRREEEWARKPPPRRTPKKIKFRLGNDGRPWTWVMGEHRTDSSYEELVRRRERKEMEAEEEEEEEIRKEAEELAKQETSHILALASRFGALHIRPLDASPKFPKRMSSDDKSSSENKLPVRRMAFDNTATDKYLLAPPAPSSQSLTHTESMLDLSGGQSETDGPSDGASPTHKQDDLRKRAIMKQVPVIGKTQEEHRRFEQERTEELYLSLRQAKKEKKKRSQAVCRSVEERWKESERKAKAIETTRKESFRRARKLSQESRKFMDKEILKGIPEKKQQEMKRKMSEHRQPAKPVPAKHHFFRKSSVVLPGTRPKTLAHIILWFRENEAPNGRCREKDGSISIWFHGNLDRGEAETLLSYKPVGSFLLRLSTKIWGYTLSVKAFMKIKHFPVEVSSGMYHFMGTNQKEFQTLPDLLKYYRSHPITVQGQEVLLLPVAQTESEESRHFVDLFTESDTIDEEPTYL